MSIKHCINLFQKLNLNTNVRIARPPNTASIFTTCRKLGLEEFFEDKENWSKEEIKVGRSWRLSDLRIKSNEDLHKIWYILLKEKNMLLTMEHYCKENYILFPNPERIDKVEESMKNLESVVRERNRAYYQLETGETGERPGKVIHDLVGMKHWHKMTQHFLPKARNPRWKMNSLEGYDINECEDFLRLYKEKNLREKRNMLRNDERYLKGLMRRYPKLDLEYLQELYPKINVKALSAKVRGHYENRLDNDDGHL